MHKARMICKLDRMQQELDIGPPEEKLRCNGYKASDIDRTIERRKHRKEKNLNHRIYSLYKRLHRSSSGEETLKDDLRHNSENSISVFQI